MEVRSWCWFLEPLDERRERCWRGFVVLVRNEWVDVCEMLTVVLLKYVNGGGPVGIYCGRRFVAIYSHFTAPYQRPFDGFICSNNWAGYRACSGVCG